MDKIFAGFVFVAAFLGTVYFLRKAWLAFRSPEFKAEMEQLREQRRRARAAKRGSE